MADEQPSPLLRAFVDRVRETYPDEQRSRLAALEVRLAATSSRADAHRGHRCVRWSMAMAEHREPTHPRWHEIQEAHRLWKDAWAGLGMREAYAPDEGGLSVSEDVRKLWAWDAVDVARLVGEEDGWDHAPWLELLDELIDLEDA